MLVISSNRTLSPRPLPTDPLLNYQIQDAAAAVGPWLYSSISSVSPPFSSSYSFGAEDLSPQASSTSTSSSPPAICPGLSSSSSYSITPHLPTAEFGGVMHSNSDEDSSADEDAFCAEPVQQRQPQQQQHQHQQPHHSTISHPTTSSSLERSSPRPIYDLRQPGSVGLPSSYPPFPRTLQGSASGSSNLSRDGPQASYLDDVCKLADPSAHTHADAHATHSDQYHHLLSSGPPTAAPPSGLPISSTPHPTSGYQKSYTSPTISSTNDAYKPFQSLPDPSNLIEHKPTISSRDLDPEILKAVHQKIETKTWEDEKSLYYQIEYNGLCVGRVKETNMVNGTKLLNLTGISRGKRDGILKNEKTRKVIKHGTMHLKGVWISFERAVIISEQYNVADLVHPLLVPNLADYVQLIAAQSMSNSKLGHEAVHHHTPQFGNVGMSFMGRTSGSHHPIDQSSTWSSSSHAISYPEPYSAPPQSRNAGYEQAQYNYLNSNPPSTDLSERRHTVPSSYNTFHSLPSFQPPHIYPPSNYGSGQFSPSYPHPPNRTLPSNSPRQFAYSLTGSHPSPASAHAYNYPPAGANPTSVYNLGPGPSTSSSATNQSSSPALHSAPMPPSPPLRSPNPLEPSGSYGAYVRGQVNSLKREAEDDARGSSGEADSYRCVQPRISSDPSPHTFRQTITPGSARYPEWNAGSTNQQISVSAGEKAQSPSVSHATVNPSHGPPPTPRSTSNLSGQPNAEDTHSNLNIPSIVSMPTSAPPGSSTGPNSTVYGSSGNGNSRPAPSHSNWN